MITFSKLDRHRSFSFHLFSCLLGCLFCWLMAFASDAAVAGDLPNVVIILVDDMGYGDPGCFNAESKIATPNIDSLAKAGMKFTDAHAPGPLCHMSRYGLMTGRYPFRADCGKWSKRPVIEPNQLTIASLCKRSGYRTAMVGKWHLGFDESGGYDQPLTGGPIDRGYDTFFGIRASTDIPPYFYIRGNLAVAPPTDRIEKNQSPGWSPIQGEFWRSGGIAPGLQLADVLPKFTDEAIAVIENHHQNESNQPLMLYLAYPAPHTPWLPSKSFQGKSGAGMYGDFLMMVDHMIGRVLKSIDQTGASDNTLVILSSDNGPVWYDEDVQRFGHDSSGPLRGMKGDAWECGHRMPMIARWPGVVKAGTSTDQMVCFTDFLATLAELTGQTLGHNDGPDSFSFLSVLKGQRSDEDPVRKQMVIRSAGPLMTIRQGNWKLINGLGSSGFSKPRTAQPQPNGPVGQLYNLADDLGETKNVYQDHPELVQELTQSLELIRQRGRSR